MKHKKIEFPDVLTYFILKKNELDTQITDYGYVQPTQILETSFSVLETFLDFDDWSKELLKYGVIVEFDDKLIYKDI